MGEINYSEYPEHQRKPGCDNEKNHSLAEAIDEHEEKKLYIHNVFWKTSRSQSYNNLMGSSPDDQGTNPNRSLLFWLYLFELFYG